MTPPAPPREVPPAPGSVAAAALLWDMDGTLVDTEPCWFAAEHALVAAHGRAWTDADAASLVGNDLLTSARVLIERGGVDLPPQRIVEILTADVRSRVLAAPPWRPGALELLAAAHDAGLPCALVTASWRSLVDAVLAALPGGTFAAVVTGDEVTRGKPDPEPYATAAAALGLDPSRCLALEDSPNGLRSALAAGVPTVGITNHVPLPSGLDAPEGLVVVDTLAGLDLAALLAMAPAPPRPVVAEP